MQPAEVCISNARAQSLHAFDSSRLLRVGKHNAKLVATIARTEIGAILRRRTQKSRKLAGDISDSAAVPDARRETSIYKSMLLTLQKAQPWTEAPLYGTTTAGGAAGAGTAFKLAPPTFSNPAWNEAVLYSFSGGADGDYPVENLTAGGRGELFGTAECGGSAPSLNGYGVVLELKRKAERADFRTFSTR
jgi:uncharacterized repeat protein (TIGR03803 family)